MEWPKGEEDSEGPTGDIAAKSASNGLRGRETGQPQTRGRESEGLTVALPVTSVLYFLKRLIVT